MADYRILEIGSAFVIVTALLAARSAPGGQHPPGCEVNSPRAAAFIATANATFPRLDSLHVERLGWRKPPKVVTLVTRPEKCDSIVAAHNRFVNGKHPAYRLTTAVIAQAGSSYLVEVPPGPGTAERMIFVYDSSLTFRTIY